MNTPTQTLKAIRRADLTLYRHGRELMLEPGTNADLGRALGEHHDAIADLVVPSVSHEQRAQARALLDGYTVTLVTDPADAPAIVDQLLADAAESGALAIDTETMVLPGHRQPIPVAINADGKIAVRQPKDGAAGAALDPRRARVRLVQAHAGGDLIALFDMATIPWAAIERLWTDAPALAMFNATFDIKMPLVSGGPEPEVRVYDCQTAMRLLFDCGDERLPSLDEASEMLLETEVPKGLGASDWSGELDQDQLDYAAIDPLVTFQLWQQQRIDFDETDESAQSIIDEPLVATAKMELFGLPWDRAAHAAFIPAVQQKLDEAIAELRQATGGRLTSNPTPAELAAYLETTLDADTFARWPRTKKSGALATGKAALVSDLAAGVPGIAELLNVRQWSKAGSSFGQSLLDKVDGDGRMHARFRVAGARTGRYSCREPNLQQLPQRSKAELLAKFRRIIAAPPGRVMAAADYGQIELRITALLTSDETMLAAFEHNEDVHGAMARALAGDEWDALDPAEQKRHRSLAKAANFGLVYGTGPAKFAETATANGTPVSLDEARAIVATWRETYAGIWEWQQSHADQCRRDGYVQTEGGRRWWWEWRALHPNDSRLDDLEDYQVADAIAGFERNFALNLPVQGTAAEIMCVALAYVDRALRGLDAGICAVVHDEIVVECADNEQTIAEVRRVLETEMLRAFADFFPDAPTVGLVDVGVGPTWADAH